MPRSKPKTKAATPPKSGWAIYLRTSSDENQKPELSRARQRFTIEKNVLERSDMPVIGEYIDVLTGKSSNREGYQRLLKDARAGNFSHVIVERADRFGRDDTEALRAIDELYEFGVSVRFANQPDLDPMDPDGRVIVALSFTLARRETALLGIRVKGGLKAKRDTGGWCGRAPDGYINVEGRTSPEVRKNLGRFNTWIEQDPERAKMWRMAWDMLLEDKMTLEEIAEALHSQGYLRASGRPFVEITKSEKRRPNVSTLSNTFHNWAYAGWLVSTANLIPPKTIRGNWDPIITTEEFERGLEILARRNQHRTVRRKQDYLLKGLIFFRATESSATIRLTCSTSNAGRSGGGTSYYRLDRAGGASFLCSNIDTQIATQLTRIQVDPDLIPIIRTSYTHDLAQQLGLLRPNDKEQLITALKNIDEEEERMARLFAAGKITETVWDTLWIEWQDRRHQIRRNLEISGQEHEYHISNLDAALEIIAKIGVLYNSLEYGDQKSLLHQVVERVIVNSEGVICLELRSPFAYLKALTDEIGKSGNWVRDQVRETKTGRITPTSFEGQCSNWLHVSWGTWTRTKIDRARTCCSAVELSPNGERV